MEIKIDRTTLPADGQKVRWQTHSDFDNNTWQQGVFSQQDESGIFCVGFKNTVSKFNSSWDVIYWEPLN